MPPPLPHPPLVHAPTRPPPVHPHPLQDLQPPKHLYIEVLVLADYGDIMTASGPVMLKKDERLLLKRTDVEHLIRQGVLAETTLDR